MQKKESSENFDVHSSNNNTIMNQTIGINNNMEEKDKNSVPIVENQSTLKDNLFPIKRSTRYCIYIMALLCLFNLDQGAISASTKDIKIFFKMTDRELGSFGGISFLGTTLGGICSLSIINKFNRRFLILTFLTLIIFSLAIPTIISSKIILSFCRILTGFSQSFMSIYLPVWIDQFGISNKKSIMMSLSTIPSAFGYLLGYICAVVTSWRKTFLINCNISFTLWCCFFCSKNLYFSRTVMPKKLINSEGGDLPNDDNVSYFEDDAISNINEGEKKESIISNAKVCFKSKLYVYSTISLITLLLILGGLQFWINDYLENVLHIMTKEGRLIFFVVMIVGNMLTAPLTGGCIMQKLGGYQSRRSIYLPLCCNIISLILANLMLLSVNQYIVGILLFGYLFSGSIMIASLNGIIISSVPKKYAGSASSISNLLYNICGRLVGPNYYGITRSILGINSRLPMVLLFDINFITLMCLYQCYKYKMKNEIVQ